MKHPLNRWLAAACLLLVAADWLTKFWVVNRIDLGHTLELIDGWLYFAHRQNTGVAFSFFATLPAGLRTPLLAGVSVAAVVLFVRMLGESRDRATRWALALVIAGAVGNLGDRILNGGVTDFILVPVFPFVFNVADAAITVGGVLLALRLVFASDHPSAPTPAGPTAG